MAKVKICGITNEEDVIAAVKAGADAVGVIVDIPEKSPRRITVRKAREIFKEIPVLVSSVVVLMPDSIEEVEEVVDKLNPDIIQLHGDESFEFVVELKERVRQKVIKVIHIDDDLGIVKKAKKFSDIADGILVDTKVKGNYGGTGRIHNWKISERIREELAPVPLILSGGLTSSNVEEAIRKVGPYAVDVSSGVELEPGKKNGEKVKEFIKNAKNDAG